jgi:type II pantothenate kinase
VIPLGVTKVGIDAGGTLVKLAYMQGQDYQYLSFPSTEMHRVVQWLQSNAPDAQLCLTGGKAATLQILLNRPFDHLVEFEATCSGAKVLMAQEQTSLDKFILTNVGTGTSIHVVSEDNHQRLGGTGVGGGTLVGLSYLLTGYDSYAEIVNMASLGARESIDLKVSHIYEGAVPPIPGNLTASNFGRVRQFQGKMQNEDLLASVIGLVGETVASVSVHAASQCGASHVVYIGSSFINNPLLAEVAAEYTQLRGSRAILLPNGQYSGAIGALQAISTT